LLKPRNYFPGLGRLERVPPGGCTPPECLKNPNMGKKKRERGYGRPEDIETVARDKPTKKTKQKKTRVKKKNVNEKGTWRKIRYGEKCPGRYREKSSKEIKIGLCWEQLVIFWPTTPEKKPH